MAGKPGRSGAPKGNFNALKVGSDVRRLTVGELPKTMTTIKREGRAYRRDLEAAVVKAKGEVNLTDSHLIDTAAAATIQAGICRWLLRHKIEDMNTSDVRGCSGDIVKAKERRDAAVRALALDVQPEPMKLSDYVIESGGKQ